MRVKRGAPHGERRFGIERRHARKGPRAGQPVLGRIAMAHPQIGRGEIRMGRLRVSGLEHAARAAKIAGLRVSRPLIAAAGTSVGASLQASCANASAPFGSRSIASSAIAVLITARQRVAVGLSISRAPAFELTVASAPAQSPRRVRSSRTA